MFLSTLIYNDLNVLWLTGDFSRPLNCHSDKTKDLDVYLTSHTPFDPLRVPKITENKVKLSVS